MFSLTSSLSLAVYCIYVYPFVFHLVVDYMLDRCPSHRTDSSSYADSYITNVDAPGSEDEEEPGAMVKADAGVIAGRKIAKGGRKKRNSSKEAG